MPKKARFKKNARVSPPRQQPTAAPPVSPPSDDDDWLIPPPPSNGGVSSGAILQPFRPPRSEPRPGTHAASGSQVTEPCNEDIDREAQEVDSSEEQIERILENSDAEKRKGRKTTEFWNVDLIDSEGIVKPAKMSVREAMERSLNGSKIILMFNEELQAVGDGAGLLSGILGALGSDYSKFSICEKSWAKVRGKDRVYDDCIKDSNGIIKKTLLQQMGKSWKDTRGRLYNSHYKPLWTLEQNLEKRPEGIPREHWRWFIDYRNDPGTKAKCKQNRLNRKKQLYTHTGGSKSLARAREEEFVLSQSEKQGRKVGRGEIFILKHKRSDGSYIHEEARKIGEKIHEIEHLDESTRLLSQNDSLAQALGKEHPGRVRGIGHGPTPSQLFRPNSQPPMDRAQVEETQRMLCELQAEVTTAELKQKAMEDELAAEKTKRQAIESVLSYLVQQHCGELPPDIAARMNCLDGHGRK
ncbi:uncharacterized protein LOC107623159 isoform X3 [Arachis ipaensis]|nr:uncharacterized protein LOC107623159 isoform X3 [Arachis ipaensis]XP_020970429.1 uncharacterized protein LOC107623159 isoform X3 [Arachis ipaensis]XP_020970431.1 uncharacterized protein LOC107623159 isoform X3 [Arachis ipaensis]